MLDHGLERPLLAHGWRGLTRGVRILLLVHAGLFVLQGVLDGAGLFPRHRQYEILGLVPTRLVHDLWIWQLGTYLFVHSLDHLFRFTFDLVVLFFFGPLLEKRLGSGLFFALYFFFGVVGGLAYCMSQFFVGAATPAVGPSGAVLGVVLLAAIHHPDLVLVLIVQPVRLRRVAGILVVLSLFSVALSIRTQLTGIVHLGGAVAAWAAYGWQPALARFLARKECSETGERRLGRILLWRGTVTLVPLGLLLAVLHFTLPGLGERALEHSLGPGTRIRHTSHFTLYGQAGSAGSLDRFAEALEAFYTRFFEEQGERFKVRPFQEPVSVLLFRDLGGLRSWHRKRYREDLVHNTGFYDPNRRLIGFVGTRDDSFQIAYHECVHMIFDTGGRKRWSRWLSEGLAMEFEGGAVGRGPSKQALKEFLEARALGRSETRLDELVTAEASDFRGEENRLFYTGSHGLVDFFLNTPSEEIRRLFLQRYLPVERAKGPQSASRIRQIFGLDLLELERRWIHYLERSVEGGA